MVININAQSLVLYVTTEKGCLVRKVDTATGAVAVAFGYDGHLQRLCHHAQQSPRHSAELGRAEPVHLHRLHQGL